MALEYNYRLTSKAKTIFAETEIFPYVVRLKIHYQQLENNAGALGASVPSDVRKGRVVSEAAAIGFVSYLKLHPDESPPEIQSILRHSPNDPFGGIFEEIVSYRNQEQTEKTDPCMGGIPSLVRAAIGSLFSLGWPKTFESDAIYPKGDAGFQEYAKFMYIFIGNTLHPKRSLTLEEAEEAGRKKMGEPRRFLGEQNYQIAKTNPDFVRYALDKNGERIGLISTFAITDRAYEETLAGNRPIFGYHDSEIVPTSNNIVVLNYAEVPKRQGIYGDYKQRKMIQSSMLRQIALLVELEERRPIRFISYEIVESNDKRLRKIGFRPIVDENNQDLSFVYPHNKSTYKVVEFNPISRPRFQRYVMMILDDLIWRIRTSIDEEKRIKSPLRF